MNELREKACRAFYAIKKLIQIEIAIKMWLKLIECVIEPVALYGSEVWGPLAKQDFVMFVVRIIGPSCSVIWFPHVY